MTSFDQLTMMVGTITLIAGGLWLLHKVSDTVSTYWREHSLADMITDAREVLKVLALMVGLSLFTIFSVKVSVPLLSPILGPAAEFVVEHLGAFGFALIMVTAPIWIVLCMAPGMLAVAAIMWPMVKLLEYLRKEQ